MIIRIKKILANPIIKNVLLLFSGAGIAQAIPFIASLFLARIYTKTDFGDLSLIMSISGIVGNVVALRYEWVVILQKKTSDAKRAMGLAFSLTFLNTLLSFVLLILLYPILNSRLDISDYSLLCFTPIIIFCIGMYSIYDNWFNRQREYKNMASLKIIQSTAVSLFRLLLGITGITWGLIGGTVIGYIITVFACIILFLKKSTLKRGYFAYKEMRKVAVSYKDYSLLATPSALLNSASTIGLPLLIAYFYSVELAGIYFFANNLIRLPISFLSNSTAQVFKKEAVHLVHINQIDNLKALIRKVQRTVLLLIFPVILILSLFGDSIFSFLFGTQWSVSGALVKYFSFYLLFGVNFSIISALIDILRLQKASLLFNTSLLFSQIIIFAICSFFMRFEYALLINSGVGSLHFFVLNKYVKHKLK